MSSRNPLTENHFSFPPIQTMEPPPPRQLQQVSTLATRKAVITWMVQDDSINGNAGLYVRTIQAGLSYRASGGLLAGVPGGQAGGLVHYALYEPGGVL
jgi:hypothetical protein